MKQTVTYVCYTPLHTDTRLRELTNRNITIGTPVRTHLLSHDTVGMAGREYTTGHYQQVKHPLYISLLCLLVICQAWPHVWSVQLVRYLPRKKWGAANPATYSDDRKIIPRPEVASVRRNS